MFPALAQQQGGENFVLINYIGQAVTLDLDDVTYTVPGVDTAVEGGRFVMQLTPGRNYSD